MTPTMNRILFGTGLVLFLVFLGLVVRFLICAAKRLFQSEGKAAPSASSLSHTFFKRSIVRVWLIYAAFLILALILMLVFQK